VELDNATAFIPGATATYIRAKSTGDDMFTEGDSGGLVFVGRVALGIISTCVG
jgi:hypothetical protein